MASYIPTKEADLVNWADNFRTLIVASPTTYGLVTADGTAINTAVNDYTTKYGVATDPNTRTGPAVAAKDGARVFMLGICRPYAVQIKANHGVTDANKLALGLIVTDPTPTRVPPPSTAPLLGFVGATSLRHSLRISDSSTPTLRKKPAGAIGLQLYMVTGNVTPTGPSACPFVGFFTGAIIDVDFEEGDVGKTAFYYARWQNRRGEEGPWSSRLQFTVAG